MAEEIDWLINFDKSPRAESAQENFASTTDKFLDFHPESRHECSICLNWLQEPILTSCGHRFCKECINAWLKNKDLCPIDNMKLNKDTDLFPDNYTKREISQQRVACPSGKTGYPIYDSQNCESGCDRHTPNRLSLRTNKLPCVFKDMGCDSVLKNEEYLASHMDAHIQNHLKLLMVAFSNLKLDQTFASTSSDGLEQAATTLWSPNDKEDGSEPTLQQANGQAMSAKILIRSLYEKVITLEQQNREQDITIGNMSRVLKSLANNQQRFFEDLALKNCRGFYVWKIDTINSKLEHMIKTPSEMFYSKGFYTAPNGHRFCIRLNLSPIDKEFIALHIHLMKTENDDYLQWPFEGIFQITLMNPAHPQKSLSDTMNSVSKLEAFQKPKIDICPKGFGYGKYIRIEQLKSLGYIMNDSVMIRIKVQHCPKSI